MRRIYTVSAIKASDEGTKKQFSNKVAMLGYLSMLIARDYKLISLHVEEIGK